MGYVVQLLPFRCDVAPVSHTEVRALRRKAGRKEGRKEGRQEGRKEGRKAGRQEGFIKFDLNE